MRYLLLFLLLSALAWAEDSQAAAQVEMLKALFREPSERWTQMLEQKRNLLDLDFFIGVEQRLARDEMMGEWVDGPGLSGGG